MSLLSKIELNTPILNSKMERTFKNYEFYLILWKMLNNFKSSEAEFKEFEMRLKFKPWLKFGWFHLKSYIMFQDLSRHSIETGFWGIWDAAQIASLLESLITCMHNHTHTITHQQFGTLATILKFPYCIALLTVLHCWRWKGGGRKGRRWGGSDTRWRRRVKKIAKKTWKEEKR